MNATISNKFFVQIIEDGTTLHGEIRATKSLTQAYKDSACIPDWTQTANQPTIYVTLQNGSTFITPDSNYNWYYNGQLITWDSNGKSIAVEGLEAGTFEKVTNYTPSGYSSGVYVPAIKIVKNLASSTNVDIDVIRFDGQATLSTNPVDFSASINITITEWMQGGGYLGIINFQNGIADIDANNKSVTAEGILYDADGNVVSDGLTRKWYFEGDSTIKGTGSSLTITDSMVVDYVMVRCEFYMLVNNVETLVYTAYAGVDDTQDPEYMWIRYNGANGNTASLRKDESVTFSAWVGVADNPSEKNTDFGYFYVKLFNSNKELLLGTIDGFTDPVSTDSSSAMYGYRVLQVSSAVASWTVTYAVGYNIGLKGLTGIILASTSKLH